MATPKRATPAQLASLSGVFWRGVFKQGVVRGVFWQGVFKQGVFMRGLFWQGVFKQGVFKRGVFWRGVFSRALSGGAFKRPSGEAVRKNKSEATAIPEKKET